MEVLERRIDKTRKMLKADKKYQDELDFYLRVKEALDAGQSARSVSCTEEEAAWLSSVSLLTNKPDVYKRQRLLSGRGRKEKRLSAR